MISDAKQARKLAEESVKRLEIADATIERIKKTIHTEAKAGKFSCVFAISGDPEIRGVITSALNAMGFLWSVQASVDDKDALLTVKW